MLRKEYIAGPNSFMKNPRAVAEELSADKYHEKWVRIPIEELYESSVDFPHPDKYCKQVSTKILLHKRRVTPGALQGTEMVNVCNVSFQALRGSSPKPSKFCLANCNWLGRHSPLFRGAPLGHQLLLALGRVVSTKVYLSSKGVDEPSRQQHVTWRQKYLQTGIKGTAIVFKWKR